MGYNIGIDEDKLNRKYQSILSNNKNSSKASGQDITENPHNKPPSGQNPTGPMKGNLMTWTQMLEAMDEVSDSLSAQSDDVSNFSIQDDVGNDSDRDKDLLDELNQIFTPILIRQDFEGDLSDKIQEAFSEASVLLENNVIKFDDETRMAQLISICALLIAKNKNSEKYQMYKKAATIRKQMKLDIQKEEYEAAKTLAQKFLVKVSTTNNSSVARNAANRLLPATQH